MTVSTLRPDGTTTTVNATVTGAASAHAALNDDSDSSYISQTSGVAFQWFGGAGDLSLPAGAVIKGLAVRGRVAKISGTANVNFAVIFRDPSTLAYYVGQSVAVTWATPTTVTVHTLVQEGFTDAEVDGGAFAVETTANGANVTRIYEVYLDVTYVEQPVVSADAPTGTVTDTNLPTVEWSTTLDSDGGAQTYYEVKVYTDAEYGGGGFDPDTTTPTATSGETAGADLSWQLDETLPDDTYRAYVRVAQTVNGAQHWSDWDFVQFDLAVALPAVPTFTATADSANARITLAIDDNAGVATTDAFEIQRSLDGGTTWETVRQLAAGELDAPGVVTVYDYEAPNGVATSYRGRSLHDYSGVWAASAWVTDSDTWSSTSWWLKHPHRPDLNMAVQIRSFPEVQRPSRVGVFQPLGASFPITVSDTRGSGQGTVVLRLDTTTEQADLDALLDENAVLMLQSPPDEGGPDYIAVQEHVRRRVMDRADVAPSFDALQFAQVDQPTGDVVAWP